MSAPLLAQSRVMNRIFCLSAALLFSALVAACGTPKAHKTLVAEAQRAQTVVDVPTLEGTPVPVCPTLVDHGLVASSYAIDEGFALVLGTYDEALLTAIRTRVADEQLEQQAIEAQLAEVRAEKHDDGNGIYIRFLHDDESTLDAVEALLREGIEKRPAAARRVDIHRSPGVVDMQLPAGGPLITSRTSSAADDTVARWSPRNPTRVEVEYGEDRVIIHIQSDDQERLGELRQDTLNRIFSCEERAAAARDDAAGDDAQP